MWSLSASGVRGLKVGSHASLQSFRACYALDPPAFLRFDRCRTSGV